MLRWLKANRPFLRFKRSRRGSAAVEFAMVVPWFFLLTFGLAEIAMIGFAQTVLDSAVADTARQIRTGQAQMGGTSYSQIQTRLCSNMTRLMALNCTGNLYLDVDTFASFVAANNANANPIQNGNLTTTGFGYTPGAPSNIVVVRAYYRWQLMTPLIANFFANSGTQRILVSTMMFRNEPYCTPGTPGCPS
jgi:Flp pilus assembly protein TadG